MLHLPSSGPLCLPVQTEVKLARYGSRKAATHTGHSMAYKKKKDHRNFNQQKERRPMKNLPKIRDVKKQVLNVNMSKTPNSCLIYIGNTRWRALIDTGADISVISEKMYKKLKEKRRITPVSQVLQGAGGKPLFAKGITEITSRLGKKK